MRAALLVGAGGFVGSILRYLVGGLVQAVAGSAFPYGTLVVNSTGCFAIGAVSHLIEAHAMLGTRTFLVVGLLGGYTTFSAFGNETVTLMRDGHRVTAGLNVGAQIVLGLAAVWLGWLTAQAMVR